MCPWPLTKRIPKFPSELVNFKRKGVQSLALALYSPLVSPCLIILIGWKMSLWLSGSITKYYARFFALHITPPAFFLVYLIPMRTLLASFYCLILAVRGDISFFRFWPIFWLVYVFKESVLVLQSPLLWSSGLIWWLSLAKRLSLAGRRISIVYVLGYLCSLVVVAIDRR